MGQRGDTSDTNFWQVYDFTGACQNLLYEIKDPPKLRWEKTRNSLPGMMWMNNMARNKIIPYIPQDPTLDYPKHANLTKAATDTMRLFPETYYTKTMAMNNGEAN